MCNIKYFIYALLLQIFISILTAYFYPQQLVLNPDKIFYNPTIFFSFSYLIMASIIAFYCNLKHNTYFNGLQIGILTLIPFILLTLYYYIPFEFAGKSYVAYILTYSFSHLGGFREFFVALLSVQSIFNFFIALNLTIVIHLLGYFIGDIAFLFRKKTYYVQN